MKTMICRSLCLFLAVLFTAGTALTSNGSPAGVRKTQKPLILRAVAWGPDQRAIDAAKQRTEASSAVQEQLKGSRYRLISFEMFGASETDKGSPAPYPTRFRVLFYNYSSDVAVIAEGDFAGRDAITVRTDLFDPGVSPEELAAGYDLVKKDPRLGPMIARGEASLYEPMPPVSNVGGERLVNIGIQNLDGSFNEIVGVSFKRDALVRYEGDAPETVRVNDGSSCGIPSAGQGSTGEGVAGQMQLTVNQQGSSDPLWEMLVIRPSSSSGASGERSGVEVRNVRYKGKSVLKRGHAPILNVKYLPGGNCNQFRDWQYAEGFYQASNTGAQNPAPGMRILAAGQVATTAVESRQDLGDYQGVAIYVQDVGNGQEVVLVSEMNAGWYRYIMEWRFGSDGTIRPRYGFGSVTNSCVCSPRNHHVYWRFDFDIVQPQNKIFQMERGRKFLRPLSTEAAVFRSYQLNRGFLIQNSAGNEAYQIIPGMNDGEAFFTNPGGGVETFGHGDFWIFQFKGTADSPGELDDPSTGSAANLNPWANGESVNDQDLVVWYSAHQYRVDDASLTSWTNNVLTGQHVVGPTLRPVRW